MCIMILIYYLSTSLMEFSTNCHTDRLASPNPQYVTMHHLLSTTINVGANSPQETSLAHMYMYKFTSKLPLMHFIMYLINAMLEINICQNYVTHTTMLHAAFTEQCISPIAM